jgi:HAD superfamily hydrolase (TIGR01509 family)
VHAAMIEAIFWDNDGVLVDTERLYFEATRDALASIGVTLAEATYVDLFMTQSTGAWHLAERAGLDAAQVATLRERRDAAYCDRLRGEPLLVPGVVDVLEQLRGRYVMGIVTSAYHDHFELVHARSGLLPYFDFVLTGRDYINFKPHPEPYLRAVERSGVAAAACLAIEDSARGLRSATAAGVRCAVIPTALSRDCNFDGAWAVLSSVADIPELLQA